MKNCDRLIIAKNPEGTSPYADLMNEIYGIINNSLYLAKNATNSFEIIKKVSNDLTQFEKHLKEALSLSKEKRKLEI